MKQLRAFEALARTGSFSRAARLLSISQPAITAQIRQLEQRCGVALVDRLPRGVRLTHAGQVVYRYAQRISMLALEVEESLRLVHGLKTGRLRIVGSLTAAAYYLPPLIAAIKHKFPGLHVQLFSDNSQGVEERVSAFEDDLGVLGGDPKNRDLVLGPFCEDDVVLIVSPQHAWAERRTVSIPELQSQPFILREPGSATRALIESRMMAEKASLRVTMELGSNEAIKQTVEMGHGVALISSAIVQREIRAHRLVALRVRDARLVRRYYLIYHRERRESPLIQAVLEVARQSSGHTQRPWKG